MPYHFYDTISGLRQQEELILYDRMIKFLPDDDQLVTDFLKIEYDAECIGYPYSAPPFNAAAALWSAKVVYTFGQLILTREQPEKELGQLLPASGMEVTAGAILSVDLCLRFLPALVQHMQRIDPTDAVLNIARQHLQQWHYSGIGFELDIEQINMNPVTDNNCLLQLYADRTITKKDIKKAMLPGLLPVIKASLGIHAAKFWKELNLTVQDGK
ncbi:MAG: hypothetical protein QM791_09150 [Ferruginibacter sp.]